jgi:hypothetical protein
MNTAVKLAKEIAVVTKDELLELADWERKHADAKRKAAAAEKEVKFRRLQLAEKVLGIKTEDELKALAPEKVQKLVAKRLEAGDWELGRGAPEFTFKKTSSGSYPAWAKLYAAQLGETAAARISTENPLQYSYSVEVAVTA